jgi:hypothetical protein
VKNLEARIARLEAAGKPTVDTNVVRFYDIETGPPELDADDAPAVVILLPRNGREAPDAR